METEKRIDEQARRRRRVKGKSVIRNHKEEVGSKQEEGIDVNRKEEEVMEAQQGDGERRTGKPAIGHRKGAKMSESEVEQEVEAVGSKQEEGIDVNHKEEEVVEAQQVGIDGERKMSESEVEKELERIWISYAIATGRKALVERESAEQRRAWLCRKEKVQTMKEIPPQDTQAAAKEQLCATTGKNGLKSGPKFDESDPMAVKADVYRRNWKYIWTGRFGSYEDITRIPPMIYTDKKLEPDESPPQPMETLQIFSVKIVETSKRFHWPLDVFGMVVARDSLDHNRNIIFHRTRDNCQTISTQNPYLELTGPSRAVVVLDPVHLEVTLQVKGSVESKDECISFLVVRFGGPSGMEFIKRVCPCKLSTVELTFGSIAFSVEATISVQVVGGSWPDGFRGEITANTTSSDDMKIQLLAFGDGKLPVAADGMVKLSRRVVSVDVKGELRVSVMAVGDQAVEMRGSKVFTARRRRRCKADVEVGSCKVKITIAWSLISDRQYPGGGSSE